MSSQVAKVLTVCGIALVDASDYEIAIAQRAVQLYRFEEAVKYFWTITRGPPCKRSCSQSTRQVIAGIRPRLLTELCEAVFAGRHLLSLMF